MRREGRTAPPSLTAAGSSSHARRAPVDAHAALLLARELLHYRPVDDLYEEWLARITERVSAAGGSPTPSLSLPRPPSYAGNAAPEAPWPQGAQLRGGTRRVQRPCSKKGAAKKSLALKKALACSPHRCTRIAFLLQHVKTLRCS